jgi:hypothetical protein
LTVRAVDDSGTMRILIKRRLIAERNCIDVCVGAVRALRHVACRARVVTSFVDCHPAIVNMGDCTIGIIFVYLIVKEPISNHEQTTKNQRTIVYWLDIVAQSVVSSDTNARCRQLENHFRQRRRVKKHNQTNQKQTNYE